eukprot:955435-Pleurochrysis_carterae.AAC.1
MAARTLSAEDEQFVQYLTLTDSQTVAATQQAYTASIRSDTIKPLLTQATQTMVIKLGLQREALADPPQILQRESRQHSSSTCLNRQWRTHCVGCRRRARATIH